MYLSSALVAAAILACVAPSTNGRLVTGFRNPRSFLADPHIVNGVDIPIEKAPYQISLETFRSHTCGGSILTEDYVLTAAHCGFIRGKYNTTLPHLISRIRAGSTTSIPYIGTGGTITNIVWQASHPKWNHTIADYDIAIIKVETPFVWSVRIQPAKLPAIGVTEEVFIDYNQKATVTGWGLTKVNGWFAAIWLKRVDIDLISREDCQGKLTPLGEVATPRMICGTGHGKGGPCNGDSGGPMVHKDHVIGVSSWVTTFCNHPENPVGFANLLDPELRLFIKQITNV